MNNNNERKPVRIYVDGCFDMIHSGHYNALRQAKTLGDVLVVGVISEIIRTCKWVDEVCV
jgi:ethanolamine-phosphate cytidylyltransferase